MELINRYVHEVGRYLPARLREAVQVELYSLIEDRLEDSEVPGESGKEETVVAILRQLGPPKKIANSYAPSEQWLIGGQFYPIFLAVLGIMLALMGGGYLIALAFSLDNFTWMAVFDALLSALPNLISAAFEAVGVLVIIFAILERVRAFGDIKTEKWDPRKLPTVDDPTRADNAWLIIETCLLLLLLLLLNFFPQRVGGYFQNNGQTTFVPLLTPEFLEVHLPLLNLWFGLGIALNVVVIWRGRWQLLTRFVDLGLSVLGLFVIYRLYTIGQIIGLNPEWIPDQAAINSLVDPQTLAFLTTILNAFLAVAFVIMIIISASQLFQLFKFFRQDKSIPSISPQS